MTDDKLNSEEYRCILNYNDDILLTESWTDENSSTGLPGYECFNFYRKYKHESAMRNRGVIVVYIKTSLVKGVKIVKSLFDTII